MTDKTLTQSELKKYLNYDPNTGIFRWKISRSNCVKPGDITGSKSHGHLMIRLFKKQYQAHRLAWLYIYGKWPENFIDHINMNRSDNRICNLREATKSENMRNRGKQSNNTSGYKGVSWHKGDKRWRASCEINGKCHSLKSFTTAEDASRAYEDFTQKNHDEFYYKNQENK